MATVSSLFEVPSNQVYIEQGHDSRHLHDAADFARVQAHALLAYEWDEVATPLTLEAQELLLIHTHMRLKERSEAQPCTAAVGQPPGVVQHLESITSFGRIIRDSLYRLPTRVVVPITGHDGRDQAGATLQT